MKPDRRSMIAVALTVVILVLFNVSIHDKEQTIANGENLFLELAPADSHAFPRADYMQLRYTVENSAPADQLKEHERRGFLVVRGDAGNVARFVRFHRGESLEPHERLVRFHHRNGRIGIVPDDFFFPEGHGELYEDAQYGVFRFDDRGRYLLAGLADGDQMLIEP